MLQSSWMSVRGSFTSRCPQRWQQKLSRVAVAIVVFTQKAIRRRFGQQTFRVYNVCLVVWASGRLWNQIRSMFSVTSAPPLQVNSNSVMKGRHALTHWTHTFNDRSATDVLGHCDWNDRNEPGFIEPGNICDIEFQHNYSLGVRQSLTWGGEVMTTNTTEQEPFSTGFLPRSDRNTTSSLFLAV